MTTQDRVNGGRPGDVPEDVWRIATDEALKFVEWLVPTPAEGAASTEHVLAVSFARAILAERERCAKVAESHGGRIRLGGFNAWHGASNIAAAIRKGGA
jgi:hypothetical protein